MSTTALPTVTDADTVDLVRSVDGFLTTRRPSDGPPVRLSLPTVKEVLAHLGVNLERLPFPTISVVGSKGKGTTTAAASAALAHHGLRVGTVTSPHLVEVRERIRIDGDPLGYADYAQIGLEVEAALESYLIGKPAHLRPFIGSRQFMLAMVAFTRLGVDVAVVEASMGGASDATSLLPSPVVAIAEIFDQHIGWLGETVADIAAEKLGAVTPAARRVLTLPQSPVVRAQFGHNGNVAATDVLVVADDKRHHPNPLMSRNMELGRRAAQDLLRLTAGCSTDLDLPPLRIPGRGQRVGPAGMVDSAVTGRAVAEAIRHYERTLGFTPAAVFGYISGLNNDAADAAAAIRSAGARSVGIVYPNPSRRSDLYLDQTLWDTVVHLADVDADTLGDSWLLVGSETVTAPVMRRLGVVTGRLW